MAAPLSIIPLTDIPLVSPGDDLVEVLLPALQRIPASDDAVAQDILVIAQKIISKAENRYVHLHDIVPSSKASRLAGKCGKDPHLVELILQQSQRVIRCRPGVIIVQHKLGFVHANAGIDHSNIEQDAAGQRVLLLPEAPDKTARELQAGIASRLRRQVGVIISDSVGRAWRTGTTGMAIGAAGITCLLKKTGQPDLMGNVLINTETGIADEIAAAASLVMGQADEGIPAVLVQGLAIAPATQTAATLIRPAQDDLFL